MAIASLTYVRDCRDCVNDVQGTSLRFIVTNACDKALRRMGVTDGEAAGIRQAIAANPEAGDVIKWLDGLRKLRFAYGGRGKSGGGRAIYFLMLADDVAALVSPTRRASSPT
jgi:hypothetical protein